MNQHFDIFDDSEKKSGNQSLKAKIKRKLFEIYFVLMKERNISTHYGMILIIIPFLQLLGFLFYRKTRFPLEDDLSESIAQFLDVIRIYPALEEAKAGSGYLTFVFLMLIFIIGYICQLIYVHYSIGINKFHFLFPIRVLRLMSDLIIWVLFIPVVETMVSIFSCEDGHHVVATDIQCWKGTHIIYIIIMGLGLFSFLFLSLLVAYFYNESRSSSVDALARLDFNLEVLFMVYRFIAAVLAHFGTSTGLHWILILFYLLGSIHFVRLYIKYFPYYNQLISILFGVCTVSYFWGSLHLLLAKIFENVNFTGQSIVIIVGIALIVPLVYNVRNKLIYKMLFDSKYDKIKKEYVLDIYMHKLSRLIIDQQHNEEDEMLLIGYVTNYKSECNDPQCPLITGEPLYLPISDTLSTDKNNYKDPAVLLHLLNSIYSEYAKNSNATTTLHTIYSNFLFYSMGNIHMSLFELNMAEKCETSIQQEFTIFKSKQFIESYLINKYGSNKESGRQSFEKLDVTIVITFENLFGQLQKNIEQSASEHIEFWNLLDSILPDLNVLHKLGLNIITHSKQTTNLWTKLAKINKNYPKALHIYGWYLNDIKNDFERGTLYLDKAREMNLNKSIQNNLTDFDQMFSDDTAVIVMSGNKETQGKITKTNSGITKLFGYNTFEVFGHDVNILMPPLLANKHQSFLEKYFITGRERMVNKERSIFGLHRSGYILCISLIVKPVPSVINDIQYIGLLRPINKNSDYILTDMQGKIDSISRDASAMFSVTTSFFNENDVYIQLICPQLFDTIGTGAFKTYFNTVNGNRELNFIIPKNFASVAQNFSKNSKGDVGEMEEADEDLGDQEYSMKSNSIEYDKNLISNAPEFTKRLCSVFKMELNKCRTKKNMLLETGLYYEAESIHRIKCEISEQVFSDGALSMKIFRLLKEKKEEDSAKSIILKYEDIGGAPSRIISRLHDTKDWKDRIRKLSTEEESKEPIAYGSDTPDSRTPSKASEGRFEPKMKPPLLSKFSAELAKPTQYEKRDTAFGIKLEIENKQELSGSNSQEENSNSNDNYSEKYKRGGKGGEHGGMVSPPHMNLTSSKNSQKKSSFTDPDVSFQEALNVSKVPLKDALGLDENILGGEELVEGLKKGREKEENFLADDVGSVSSNSNLALLKQIAQLRNMMDEKYNPPSIRQLNLTAQLIFLCLFIIMVSYYYVGAEMYHNMKVNVGNLKESKNRIDSITAIGYQTRTMNLLKEGLVDVAAIFRPNTGYQHLGFANSWSHGIMNYENWTRANMDKSAIQLKKSQNYLAISEFSSDSTFTGSRMQDVNPEVIVVEYKTLAGIADVFELDTWSAVMGLVIHANNIKDLPLNEFLLENESIFYILRNSFNSLIKDLKNGADAITFMVREHGESNTQLMLILCIIGSVVIFASLCLIMPVVFKVKKNNQNILALFLAIPNKKIKEQLVKCRKFFNMIHGESDKIGNEEDQEFDVEELTDGDSDDELKEKEKEGKVTEEKGQARAFEGDLDYRQKSKNRKFKPYTTGKCMTMLKFAIFASILEVFFLYLYFEMVVFLDKSYLVVDELGMLSRTAYSNDFLFRSQQEMIATRGLATIIYQPTLTYVPTAVDLLIKEQEDFLKLHSENLDFNGDSYNHYFDNLIYKNFCEHIFHADETAEIALCSQHMGGILTKGMHSANVAYWDYIRESTNDFLKKLGENPNEEQFRSYIKIILNEKRRIENEILYFKYFSLGFENLFDKLADEQGNKFDSEFLMNFVIFIIYIFLLFFLYFCVWHIFVESTRKSQWITKSMLLIIPAETILEVEKIKDFLIHSSKSIFLTNS